MKFFRTLKHNNSVFKKIEEEEEENCYYRASDDLIDEKDLAFIGQLAAA